MTGTSLPPLFIDKMKSNSEGEYLEFKLTSNKKDFDIYLKKGFSATYTLNGKELFIYSVDEDVKLGTLLLQTTHSNSAMYLELPSERYIGKQIYSDRKIRKGLEGHIVWGRGSKDISSGENTKSQPRFRPTITAMKKANRSQTTHPTRIPILTKGPKCGITAFIFSSIPVLS